MNLILPISKVKKKKNSNNKKEFIKIAQNKILSRSIFRILENLSTSNKSIPLLRIHGTIRISRNIKSLSRV